LKKESKESLIMKIKNDEEDNQSLKSEFSMASKSNSQLSSKKE
jgi:hypothetical protein